MADMRSRCALIEEVNPALVVSIHQNSYHEEPISGGQVFYYKTSEKGKKLAEILQKRFYNRIPVSYTHLKGGAGAEGHQCNSVLHTALEGG